MPVTATPPAAHPPAADVRRRDALLIALTLASGVVDAASYLGLGHIFTANMTGNTIFLAIAAGQGNLLTAVRSADALVAFGIGAFVAGRYLERVSDPRPWPRAFTVVLWGELVLAAGFSALWIATGGSPDGAVAYAMITVSATGMGMQSAVGRKVAIPGVTTNVLTMAFTGLMAELAALGVHGSHARRWTAVIVALALGAGLGGALYDADRILVPVPLLLAVGSVCVLATWFGHGTGSR